jgi:hypothetical protein
MNLIQITNGQSRRVAIVHDNRAELLRRVESVYALAQEAILANTTVATLAAASSSGDLLDYDSIYSRASEWRLLPSFDHPFDAAHCMVSGTGLTHKASAENRASMHHQGGEHMTDSMRMYQMGIAGGNPAPGSIGTQPEWFYKGHGSIVKAHGDELDVPPYAEDGGEEPEIAGVYIIAPDGSPMRVGFTVGNEFSDHQMEKRNYLYLAPSKLRDCSIGPELVVGEALFESVEGSVAIYRSGACVWNKKIFSGAANMCHSLANIEHHQFKYASHRIPGHAHIHFFGADAFSFGDGVQLQSGDVMSVYFDGFGRPLRNVVAITRRCQELVTVARL